MFKQALVCFMFKIRITTLAASGILITALSKASFNAKWFIFKPSKSNVPLFSCSSYKLFKFGERNMLNTKQGRVEAATDS